MIDVLFKEAATHCEQYLLTLPAQQRVFRAQVGIDVTGNVSFAASQAEIADFDGMRSALRKIEDSFDIYSKTFARMASLGTNRESRSLEFFMF